MKTLSITLCFCIFSFSALGEKLAKIDSLLCDIYVRDQTARKELVRLMQNIDSDSLMQAYLRVKEVDRLNQEYVIKILDEGKWEAALSEDAHRGVFLVIDHSPLVVQQKYFPLIKQMSEKGCISKSDCATLQDRILMSEGKKQIYGTQTVLVQVNTVRNVYLWPVEKRGSLDSLRKSVGLLSLSSYLEVMKKERFEVQVDHSYSMEQLSKHL